LGRVLFRDGDLLCTDCKLVGGDSGGPLFNMRGEVVGIHSSIGPSLTHNFHVPVTAFRRDWDRLLAKEMWGGPDAELDPDRAMLGVRGDGVDGQCVVTVVMEGLPAARAGVRVGDVIARVNSREIDSFDDLRRIVAFKRPGDRVTLTIERDGETHELAVQLSRPDGTVPDDD
jgi:serine protease Do